ncbi:MAG TPA: acyl-CoA dehydratase activase-related protein [Clostridia bacterium]|nr:acyl-CoA dehydratase activase-related protein [Clostridia bacterium]
MVNVAIPRAMSYYYLYPFFKTLFSDFKVDTVLSKPTTKATLQLISECPTDEPCLAVKLYFAHVKQLSEEKNDYIFLPKIVSVEKGTFCCPKFIGIPDMVKSAYDMKERILSPRINLSEKRCMMEDISELAHRLGYRKHNISQIITHAWKVQKNVLQYMVDNRLTTEEAYTIFERRGDLNVYNPRIGVEGISAAIGLIGHPYVLYEWISCDLTRRLREYGKVITPEMIDKGQIKAQMKHIYEGHKLWSFEAQMLGAALHLIRNHLVDKLVLVGLFECGPESIIEVYIEEEAEKFRIPLLKLYMDDQTGEAGLITRIEAFMDTSADVTVEPEKNHSSKMRISKKASTKPVIGFPSMGHLDIVMDSIFKECGVKTIKPPALSRQAIELGKELAPEFICLPMTATLGQMLQMLELGVDHIFMIGGKGKCRLGWYGQIQELLLKRKGLSFDVLMLDSPFPLIEKGNNFVNTLKKVTGGADWEKVIKSTLFGYHKLRILDEAEILCRRFRAFEKRRGEADRLFTALKHHIHMACDYQSMSKVHREFEEKMISIETEDTNPLRIRLVGEFWVLMEPFINMEIEKHLGSREGVRILVEREVSISHWLQGNLLHNKKALARKREIEKAAAPYLSEPVGGHGQESVGLTVLASKERIDGVVHLMPFTCMPEIVAQSIITKVSDKLDIPVLSHIVSDQTGEAGVETRLDAFIDLLMEKRFEKSLI